MYINLLQSSSCSSKCYTANARFVATAFEYAIYSEHENIKLALVADLPKVGNELERTNILNKMFSVIIPLLDSTFEKGDLGKSCLFRTLNSHSALHSTEKFRSLLSLLQIITSSLIVTIDEEFVGYISNKLLHFMSSIKSLAQSGSNLNKNCLLVVSNLMHTSDNDVIDSNEGSD